MTGGEMVVQCLVEQGVRHVFGIPGGHVGHIYDGLYKYRDDIAHILVRHEQGAAFMADGYARTTGEVGVCITVPGPGASNTAAALGEAYTDCVPVLLITGQTETRSAHRDKGKVFHGLDQMTFFKPITKWNGGARTVEEIPEVMERAFRELRTGRPQPVQIEFPQDLLSACCETEVPDYVRPFKPEGDPSLVRRAGELLRAAERPAILADEGVTAARASGELAQVAELLGAPVYTAPLAKGAIWEEHPLACSSSEVLALSDLVLALGCRFTDMLWRSEKGETAGRMVVPRMIQVDPDVRELGREYPAEVGIEGDVKTVLSQLMGELKTGPPLPTDRWGGQLEAVKRKSRPEGRCWLIQEMREAMDQDAILSVDVTMSAGRAHSEFTVCGPRMFLAPTVYVTMGYAFPAALGAKVAHPNRQVVALTGDGCFQMTLPDLATAAEHKLNVVTVVVNNNGLGAIRRMQKSTFGGRYLGVDMINPDFVKLAEAFKVQGVRVTESSEFGPAFRKALETDIPTVIEVTAPLNL